MSDVTQQKTAGDEPRMIDGIHPATEVDPEVGVPEDGVDLEAGPQTHPHESVLRGYRAAPVGQPVAAVLVIHENKGLTPYVSDVCRRLARRGYVALAPDLLSRAGGSDAFADHDPAIEALREIPSDQLVEDAIRWDDYLLSQSTRTGRLGVIGFCFGGRLAWRLATCEPRLSAVVAFYGANPPIEAFGSITAPVLGIYGEHDTKVTAQIPDIEATMRDGGKTFRSHVYPGAGHAFHNDLNPRRYHATSARGAWVEAMDWLDGLLC